VRAFALSSQTSGGPGDSKRLTKPAAYDAYYEFPGVNNLDGARLHSALNQFASKYEEGNR
jgi:hypothetical protein